MSVSTLWGAVSIEAFDGIAKDEGTVVFSWRYVRRNCRERRFCRTFFLEMYDDSIDPHQIRRMIALGFYDCFKFKRRIVRKKSKNRTTVLEILHFPSNQGGNEYDRTRRFPDSVVYFHLFLIHFPNSMRRYSITRCFDNSISRSRIRIFSPLSSDGKKEGSEDEASR